MRTIFALATARGKSGVAVIRISGPDAFEIGTRLVGKLPAPGHFALRSVRDRMGAVLDDALVLTFQAPRSFSGEDTIELQTHGSVAVVQAVERAISDTGLARLAEPGEFTQRALLNGQLDLSQVEGLGDLLAAETELQRQQAQDLFRGTLRDFAETCRRDLLRAMALIEATIDFADEDVPVDVTPEVVDLISGAVTRIEEELDGFAVSERLRHGFEVAIVGAPNVGKSTLLNRIAGRDVAITSDVPGTTRDVLEVRTDLNGIPVTFLDTAGLRDTDDVVERIGVGRAIERAQDADLRIRLETSSDDWMNRDVMISDLVYRTKADLTGDGISAVTGEGIDGLLDDVAGLLEQRLSGRRSASHERHRQALLKAKSFLATADECLRSDADEAEIAALHVRDAVNALDSLIGRIDVEAVLGKIFSEFCIGK